MAQRGNSVAFGDFGLMALEATWVTSRQIEAARRAITHHVKRGGQDLDRIFQKAGHAKPAETRMGSGKGAVDHYVAVVKPGRIMFELGGVRRRSPVRHFCCRARKCQLSASSSAVRTWRPQNANQELRELDSEALESQLKEHYEELFNLRFQQVMGKLTASGRPRIVKREVRADQDDSPRAGTEQLGTRRSNLAEGRRRQFKVGGCQR